VSSTDELASIIHIWGDVGTGKTTLCYAAALSTLVQKKKVIYISTKPKFKDGRFEEMMQNYPEFDEYNFLLYTPSTFSQQTEIIMNLEFLILEEIQQLKKTSIGLIVLDSASILRHLEMKSESINQKTLRTLNTTIATLDYIRRTYTIPILVTNRHVIRIKNDRNVVQPASNAVMKFWAKIRLKIQRTDSPAIRDIVLENHPTHQNLPYRIQSKLKESGFT
jgi:RecA/RadA recombinase